MEDSAKNLLTERERAKREKRLEHFQKAKSKGFWRYVLVNAFGIAVGISIGTAFNKSFEQVIAAFPVILLITSVLFSVSWFEMDKKIGHISRELDEGRKIKRKHRILAYFIVFLILVCVLVVAIVFSDEIKTWDDKRYKDRDTKLLEKVNAISSSEPAILQLQISDGTKAIVTVPQAYLIAGNDFRKEGVFSSIISSSQLHLATSLPELEPWKLSETILRKVKAAARQEVGTFRSRKVTVRKSQFLKADSNYVGITITSLIPIDDKLIMKTFAELSREPDLSQVPQEEKHNLRLYHIEAKVPAEIDGKKVYFFEKALVATPLDKKYPPMIFTCDRMCTIISSYGVNVGLVLDFHTSQISKWQEIWDKAHIKIDSIIEWE